MTLYQNIGIIVDCSILLYSLRMSPSMDMVEKQSRLHKFTNFQHQKIKKDKTRLWRGNIQRKRLYVLKNLTKLAFNG
jgi:hypothetical protein